MGKWDNYDSLAPDEKDLSEGWKKEADLPPPIMAEFQFKPGRQPDAPRFVFPDGMIREMTEELKDGYRVPVNATVFQGPMVSRVFGETPGGLAVPTDGIRAEVRDAIRFAVTSLLSEMEQRTKTRLTLTHWDKQDAREHPESPIVYDDQEGKHHPQVRFAIAPR